MHICKLAKKALAPSPSRTDSFSSGPRLGHMSMLNPAIGKRNKIITIALDKCSANFSPYQTHLDGLSKHRWPRVFDPVDLVWGLEMYIFKSSHVAWMQILGPPFKNLWLIPIMIYLPGMVG